MCPTLTPDAREAFLRAMWAANLAWCSTNVPLEYHVRASEITHIRAMSRYTHAFMREDQRCIYFAENANEVNERLAKTHTLVNSARHFVTYARRLKGQT